ncbi:hypothetical protein ACFYYR_29675 [Streptomyces sp. NPDC001922]|uniref:hypothetical protein n=1 Tax=Streptomyces sp. NPDC001922 TaxID=3364624 RepID=UPI0036BD4BF4
MRAHSSGPASGTGTVLSRRRACSARGWSRAFCAHALDFLAPRAPEGGLTLVAADGPEVRGLGAGERPVTVRGALADLTAWLAGRVPEGPVDAEPGPLPGLRPWP